MRPRILLPTLAALTFLLVGCGHTNHLKKYNVVGRTAYFRTNVSAGAAGTYAGIESPNKDLVGEIFAAVGSAIVSDQGRKKLERAINGDSIGQAISRGMTQATSDYLRLQSVESMADNPDFIVENELTDYKLVSTSAGLCVRVSGNARMIDRATGAIVWEDSESHTIPLSQTYLAAAASRPIASGASVFNAIQLLSLSEDEIRRVIDAAAQEAGREIGETLREDVAEMHEPE